MIGMILCRMDDYDKNLVIGVNDRSKFKNICPQLVRPPYTDYNRNRNLILE